MRRLEGKVAIITGSGSGIGRATALLFAEEGAKVVVVDIDPKGGEETVRKIKEKNGEASFVQTNVMKYEEVKMLIDRVIMEYGKIDVLHNNAGGWVKGFSDTVIDDQESEWNRMIDLNLKSLYYTSKEVVPHMMKAKKGSIINTVTMNATVVTPGTQAYSAAKAGALSLTKSMSIDFGKYGIRVNGISPGEVLTPQWIATINTAPDPEHAKQSIIKKIPLGRLAEAEDVARVALWLASDESEYISGVNIPVDGGLTAGYTPYAE
jgi:NAD(P)-dependent dehydrogenase (short-subunit alcohol dehydrogenase family)